MKFTSLTFYDKSVTTKRIENQWKKIPIIKSIY